MKALQEYFAGFKDIGNEFVERVAKNPLRVLDTKVPEWQDMVAGAPRIIDFLSSTSQADFDYVQESLTTLGIPFTVVPTMVRGLDYYTNTAFEFVSNALDAAQSTVCGGGRYNKLVAEMDGPETPGIGFGLGIERLLLALEAENITLPVRGLDVFVIDLLDTPQSREVLVNVRGQLRNGGFSVDSLYGAKSMKAAMKNADRSNARFTILLGESEREKNVVALKDMTSGEQREVSVDDIVTALA